MPDIHHQPAALWHFVLLKTKFLSALAFSSQALMVMVALALPGLALADSTPLARSKAGAQKSDPNGYDLAIIIDNRETAGSPAAKEDLKALSDMLDRHLFVDHTVRLQRPSLAVICDIFGGCPNEASHAWPPLIAQLVDRADSRLFVYYLGPARIEGRERQLIFATDEGQDSRGTGTYAVGWLHKQLEKTGPKSALVIMEASFAPRPLPCVSENPILIDATMKTVRRNYMALVDGRYLPSGFAELTATLPFQAPHCDRFEQIADGTERPLFTKFVLKGIVEGEADKAPFGNEDGIIELGELQAYTGDRIERAVQFQWGQEQNVWRIGPGSRPLASVKPREPIQEPMQIDAPDEAQNEVKEKPQRPKQKEPRNGAPSSPSKEHVCEQDQASSACIDFCSANPDSFHCAIVCTDQEISEACPCTRNDPRPDCGVGWCAWSAEHLGSSTETLIQALGLKRAALCQGASGPERAAKPNVFWQLFTPIIGRLAWPLVQPWFACLLKCDGSPPAATPGSARMVGADPMEEPVSSDDDLVVTTAEPAPTQATTPATDNDRTAFNEEVCDQLHDPLPPYIGLPRWMPGTLLISEALRSSLGCSVPLVRNPGRLKRAPYFASGMPPPVWHYQPRYATPPTVSSPPPPRLLGFATPPPVELTTPPLPPFEPSIGQIRWLQSALTLGNFDPGPIDGTMGEKTEAALERWRDKEKIGNVVGALTRQEFERIVTWFGEKFDQVHLGAPLYQEVGSKGR